MKVNTSEYLVLLLCIFFAYILFSSAYNYYFIENMDNNETSDNAGISGMDELDAMVAKDKADQELVTKNPINLGSGKLDFEISIKKKEETPVNTVSVQ